MRFIKGFILVTAMLSVISHFSDADYSEKVEKVKKVQTQMECVQKYYDTDQIGLCE